MECAICNEIITKDNKYQTTCNHLFCNSCITKWMEVRLTCSMCRIPMENKKAKYELNMFYHVFDKVSKLHFQGKLVAIDPWNYDGFRYTFCEISNSSRPMANVYWSFNDMACITQL